MLSSGNHPTSTVSSCIHKMRLGLVLGRMNPNGWARKKCPSVNSQYLQTRNHCQVWPDFLGRWPFTDWSLLGSRILGENLEVARNTYSQPDWPLFKSDRSTRSCGRQDDLFNMGLGIWHPLCKDRACSQIFFRARYVFTEDNLWLTIFRVF